MACPSSASRAFSSASRLQSCWRVLGQRAPLGELGALDLLLGRLHHPAVAQPHQRVVCRDAVYPGAEGRIPPEILEVLVRGQEGVLGDLRRVRLRARHPQRQAEHLVPVGLHQRLEGGHVPGLRARQELLVVLLGLRPRWTFWLHPSSQSGRRQGRRRASGTARRLTWRLSFTHSRKGFGGPRPRVVHADPRPPRHLRLRPPTPPARHTAAMIGGPIDCGPG